jgi:hypothetical protein
MALWRNFMEAAARSIRIYFQYENLGAAGYQLDSTRFNY